MRWVTAGCAALVAIYVSACSGKSASDDDDDDGGSSGDSSSGKGGTGGSTGGTGTVGKGGGSTGGTSGTGGGGVGPSGLPSDAYLDELTSSELYDLCAWVVPLEGGPGTKQCDSSTTLDTPTVEDCALDTVTIHCTVGMVERCALTLNGDACMLLTSAPCEEYIQCALGSSP